MTPRQRPHSGQLSVSTLLDLPWLRITWEQTDEWVFAAGVVPSNAEALLGFGPRVLIFDFGRN